MILHKNCKDISSQKFGMLTAVSYARSNNGAYWVFECDCGNSKELRLSVVSGGHQKSCGCLSKKTRFNGAPLIEGEKYNELTAVKMVGKSGHNTKWSFLCFCGQPFIATASNVARGNTKSCGCLKKRVLSEKARTHGMSETSAYRLWSNMMRRCGDPLNAAYKNYGGRGIEVCDQWRSFERFFLDMGDRPKGRTLERRDNNKGYSLANCYWATWKQQSNNKRTNVMITIGKETKTISQWCEIKGIPSSRVFARRKLGWSDNELFLPKSPSRSR